MALEPLKNTKNLVNAISNEYKRIIIPIRFEAFHKIDPEPKQWWYKHISLSTSRYNFSIDSLTMANVVPIMTIFSCEQSAQLLIQVKYVRFDNLSMKDTC